MAVQLLRRHPLAALGALVFLCVVASATLAAPLAPRDPLSQDISVRLQPPGWVSGRGQVAWLGTDQLGRDILSRIIYGSRISLFISCTSVAGAGLLGFGLGLLAGYHGGVVDTLITGVTDLQLAFPFILLALAIIALVGPSLRNIMLVLAITSWPVYARVVRASVFSLKRQEFVTAAHALGQGSRGVIFKHLVPNTLSPLIVIASFEIARMIIAESALSFLGLGVQPPTPTWGNMVADGRLYIGDAWWLTVFPGLAVMLTVTGVNLAGDGLRDVLDPRLKHMGG